MPPRPPRGLAFDVAVAMKVPHQCKWQLGQGQFAVHGTGLHGFAGYAVNRTARLILTKDGGTCIAQLLQPAGSVLTVPIKPEQRSAAAAGSSGCATELRPPGRSCVTQPLQRPVKWSRCLMHQKTGGTWRARCVQIRGKRGSPGVSAAQLVDSHASNSMDREPVIHDRLFAIAAQPAAAAVPESG